MPTRLNPHAFAGHRVLVVGDAILDCYRHGTAARISREAPIPVLTNQISTYRCGGAANTAANITALGSSATLVALCGADENHDQLLECCTRSGINTQLLARPELATIRKTRILASGQQLLRIDDDPEHSAGAEMLCAAVLPQLAEHDVVILSDYGYNSLTVAPQIIAAAHQEGVKVVVDPRGNTWDRYAGADLVTPNLEEFNHATSDPNLSVTNRAAALMETHRIQAILLTAGASGMTLFTSQTPPQQQATRSIDVFDTTGAGDTVVALMALGMSAGAELADAMHWANVAASIVVTKLGTAAVTNAELAAPPAGRGAQVVSLPQLLDLLATKRAAYKSVVMTNGCFDILHAGHIQSLASAARLGDVLVVAVNDDQSVRGLKGEDRPIIPLAERMQVLAALGCVDYVIAFAEANAVELVSQIIPDIYVKGDDWAKQPPPEAALTEQLGGKVVFQSSSAHMSTTEIIRRIRQVPAKPK